ncbi:MAG TPA: hypothetical protein VFW98_06400 [Gemmatimonadaceae bacterium]|nr:hypothetical protein [Gemmatimonadaceae bacterium]
MRIMLAGCALAITLGGAAQLSAQRARGRLPSASPDSMMARFLDQARMGAVRYQDRAAAVADGYRQIGPDFPGMGEHWIQLSALFRDTLDPAHPPVLEYVDIAGTPRLVGVTYALPLLAGESPPDFPSVHAWHDHVGTVLAESMMLDQLHSDQRGAGGARIVMLHAWIGLTNPAGMFVSDNWALPFVRAGVQLSGGAPSPAAGRAVSLLTGGDVFYTAVAEAMSHPGAADSAVIRDTVRAYRGRVAAFIHQRAGTRLGAADLAALGELWRQLWAAVGAAVQPSTAARLTPLTSAAPSPTETP